MGTTCTATQKTTKCLRENYKITAKHSWARSGAVLSALDECEKTAFEEQTRRTDITVSNDNNEKENVHEKRVHIE